MEQENAASEIIHSEEIKSFICCVHWEKFQIDGFEILGKQADSFLQLFDDHLINNEEYILPCGFLSQVEQGLKFNINHFGFIDIVSYFEDGLAYYTTINLDVVELLNLNYTLRFEELAFDKQNRPSRQVLLNFWNIDPRKVDKHNLKLSNGISDDALILHFDENGFLSTIEYWSPC